MSDTTTIYAAKDFLVKGRKFFHGEIVPPATFDPTTTARMIQCGWLAYGQPSPWLAKQASERREKLAKPAAPPAPAPTTVAAQPAQPTRPQPQAPQAQPYRAAVRK